MASRLNFSKGLDFNGTLAAGAIMTLFIDGGPTYEEFAFESNMPAASLLITISVNGDDRVKLTGQQMLDREAYDGRTATAGHFVFSFADNMARVLQGEGFTSLVTRPNDRVKITVEVDAGDATVDRTLQLYVETTGSRPEEFVLRVLPEQVPVTQTGENNFAGFRRASRPSIGIVPQLGIRRVFGYGAIAKLAAKQDGRNIFGERNLEKAANDARLKRNGKTVPTSSTCFVYDPICKGNVIQDLLDTFSREFLRFTFTTTTSADIVAVTEYVEDVRPTKAA